MTVAFAKMNGAGNDFVLMDNRDGRIRLSVDQVVRICDRHRGIGADGLLLVRPCPSGKADWAWDFYNSDGSKAEMCGNGARCFARYVQRLAGAEGRLTFETGAGVITASFEGERVTVNLTEPRDCKLNQKIAVGEGTVVVHSINTGVPHAVVFETDADKAMVPERGRELRFHPHFAPRGTNVNFVQLLGDRRIRVRTYERGVEGETLACGTGVSASALIAARIHGFASPVHVQVQGGDELRVDFDAANGSFQNVRLNGPAEFVFIGEIAL